MASFKIPTFISFLFKLLVTIILFIFLWQKIDINELWFCLKKIKPLIFFLSILLYALSQIISSYRWQLLLRVRDIHISLKKLISFYFVGMFFNMFLPTLIGGDIVRSWDLSRHTKKTSDSIVSIFAERFIGLLALMLIALISLTFTYEKIKEPVVIIFVIAVAILAISAAFILGNNYLFSQALFFIKIFRKKNLMEKIEKVHGIFLAYRQHKLVVVKTIMLSFIVQALNILIYYLIARSIGIRVSFIYFALFIPIIILMAMLPISLQGLGIREGTSVFLFTRLGVSPSYAFSLSIIYFVAVVITSLGGGIIFLTRRREN